MLEIITLTYREVNESKTGDEGAPRTLLSGTIDDVGNDLRKIKEMGINHMIFGLTNPDLDWVIDTAKRLSKSIK